MRAFALLLVPIGLAGMMALAGCPAPSARDGGDAPRDAGGDGDDAGPEGDGGLPPPTDGGGDGGAPGPSELYERLGGAAGATAIVSQLVGGVTRDPAINGYFANAGHDRARLVRCLEVQVAAAAGGPQSYPEEGDAPIQVEASDGTVVTCRHLRTAHLQLGISTTDYIDFRAHLAQSIDAHRAETPALTDDDALVLLEALAGDAVQDAVVEDSASNATLYQRVGRKPALIDLVDDALGRVVADPVLSAWFGNQGTDAERLATCLVRQLCEAAGGPCDYDAANPLEDALVDETGGVRDCAAMSLAHASLGLGAVEQDTFKGHVLDAALVLGPSPTDLDTLAVILDGTDDDIVTGPADTPFSTLGGRPGLEEMVDDLLARLVADSAVNAWFLNEGLALERLDTCLVRLLCEATGGPCVYGAENAFETALVDAEGGLHACRSMAVAHEGLALTQSDVETFNGHVLDAALAQGLEEPSLSLLAGSLAALVGQVAEGDGTDPFHVVGGRPGLEALVDGALTRVAGDNAVNGWFANASVDDTRLGVCLVRQLCDALGGPCEYGHANGFETALSSGGGLEVCLDMAGAHAGLSISAEAFEAFTGHVLAEADVRGVGEPARTILAVALLGTEADIVEDPAGDLTAYARVGGKPALLGALTDDGAPAERGLVPRLRADVTLGPFFADDGARLVACLLRQLCALTDGPCDYDAAGGVVGQTPTEGVLALSDGGVEDCRDMATAHVGASAGDGGPGIARADFDAFIVHFDDALQAAGMNGEDRAALLADVGGLCGEVVEGGAGCD